ncbi:folate family ECF transporter S component [Catenisphaera adipataccumulans]|jgi:ECF transporter S component (folate family)|uniref:ECF transporter S component (Folate family) n=1 Tax=Catenisphaera adipataccumulans TaxID=700500 RepID=A0A7W8FUD8_9FIRM|nr:folate family ECF transporter S component [Catenisphaera adipataccumulans]MBB5182484.1 ECF transporter S component (folate family) [Catenisphaera adipataccumulans]
MSKLKDVKVLSGAAMLVAVGILLGFFKIPLTQLIEIRFGSLPIAIAGAFYGTGIGALVGALTDIGAFLVKPTGPYFPGFTISGLVSGFIFGKFFYGKEITVQRIVLAEIVHTLIVGIGLNSIWLSMLYGNAFMVVLAARLLKEIVMIPVNSLIVMVVLKPITRLYRPQVTVK